MKVARNAAWMRVCTVCSASIRTGDRVPRRSCSGSCSAWSMRRRGPWARAWSAIRETATDREHTSELQSHSDLVCRLLLEKKKEERPVAARGGLEEAVVVGGTGAALV